MADNQEITGREFGKVEEKVDTVIELVKDLTLTLKGNGKPGLCTEVELIKQKQGWMWAGLGSAALAVLGLIVEAAKRYMFGG